LIIKDVFHKDPKKNNINYDIKANTLDYLKSMIFIVDKLRVYGRNLQFLPVRSSFVPKYITIDTTSLILLMVDKGSETFKKKVKDSREKIWSTFFNLRHKVFKRKDYKFFSMIKTDGVGASVILYRSDLN
jgi:hypothetical protein